MKINELHIGDIVCQKDDRFPMVVVGLHSTLDELAKGQGDVYLDFEGNEGDMWEVSVDDLIKWTE
ncbi:hypothetical protein CLI71_06950 [Prevotella intermedia]|uniref:DUF4926 domain-containing protein n=1 Tax=Prevotella intermedia TaxID=28131 RepID=A0A2A6EEN1_PREIN|nr:hypothetical protein CLI71_06950 [Prevotella intermedia]